MMDWEKKLLEEAKKIIEHGFGKVNLSATETGGNRTKIIIDAGKSWVFYKEKNKNNKTLDKIKSVRYI